MSTHPSGARNWVNLLVKHIQISVGVIVGMFFLPHRWMHCTWRVGFTNRSFKNPDYRHFATPGRTQQSTRTGLDKPVPSLSDVVVYAPVICSCSWWQHCSSKQGSCRGRESGGPVGTRSSANRSKQRECYYDVRPVIEVCSVLPHP